MKLEVGMYVRDDYFGIIRKIYSIDKKRKKFIYDEKHGFEMFFSQVKTASYNLIDLIEVGDYVNGYRIVKIFVNKYNGKKLLIALYKEEDYEYSDNFEDYMCDDSIHIYEEDIKTILTKEQFENNCYKVIEK